MILRHYLLMIKKGWWLVVVCTLAAWSVSLAISLRATPLYRASASFIISPNANLSSSRDVVTSLDTLDKRSIVSTYADILSSERVFEETARQLELDPQQLQAYATGTVLKPESNILVLNVEGPDPALCTSLANNIGQNGITFIKGIYQVFDINFLDQAKVPQEPFSPRALYDGAVWAGFGLLAGLLLAIAIETMREPLSALRQRSYSDRESGAFSYKHFVRTMEQEIARDPARSLSLGLLELQGLQDIIDALPETARSELMRRVTDLLRQQLRGNDVIGRWDRCVFAISLPATDEKAAEPTFKRIRKALQEPVTIPSSKDEFELAPVIGLVSKSGEEETAALLAQHARTALEKAHQSSNKTVIYDGK